MKRSYLALLLSMTLAIALIGLAQWLVSAAQPALAGGGLTQPPGPDLDVTFINRAPMYKAYCVEYPWDVPGQPGIPFLCPGTEDEKRWPAPGEIVTFTAHIVNKGVDPAPASGYAWQIDGATVSTGTLPALAPGEAITTTYQWPWAHTLSPDEQRLLGNHTIGFIADPDDEIVESYEVNNQLTDPTNAMSFGFYVTPQMYAAYNTPVTDTLPFSAEDWLQKQMAAMNQAFANAGSAARVRINTIEISIAYPSNDFLHDGGWFVDADYRRGASGYYDPPSDIDWGLIHEMAHQMALIDLYASNIYPTEVYVLNQSGRAANFGFEWATPDAMNDPGSHIFGSHTAGGAASNIGYRNGYYGAYQFDIPQENYLLILDSQGNPAPGIQIALFQRQDAPDSYGRIGINNTPEITGTTGADGRILLANRSANGGTTTATGHALHDNPFGAVDIIGVQNRFLLRIVSPDHEEFRWMDISDFNLAYWAGDTISHTFTITSHVPPSGAPASPEVTAARVQGFDAHLCWNPVHGAAGYIIYRADPPDYIYRVVSDTVSGPCYDEIFPDINYGGHIYTIVAVDSAGRQSGFSAPVWFPDGIAPVSLVIAPNQERIVLSHDSWYALLKQAADGRYLQNLGSVEYHLDYSSFLALDANGRLLISHPGDGYDSRQSVRIATQSGDPIFEFGEYGSGPGQFDAPAGVASWGPACSVEGPLTDDPNTLLLLHFDNNYTGEQGETGVYSGTTFTTGRYGQGVLIDNADTLTYITNTNLDRAQGAIEFWLRPDWNGDDNLNHNFLDTGYGDTNRLTITKDGGNNLRFILWDSSQEYGTAYWVGFWQAGEWHHVAAVWQGTRIYLYVDGILRDSRTDAHPPDSLANEMYIGSSLFRDSQADALIDELRISNIPRVGNSNDCNHFLVADSGNDRIQVFDSIGNFLAEFGTSGSGEGQFSGPQGIAFDAAGRLLVVDSGNNRVAALDFDGVNLAWAGSFTAGLNAPTGIAVAPNGHIFVADTGNNRIVELNPNGSFVAEYTHPNDGYTGNFNAPQGAAVAADGTIIVADTGNQRVVTVQPVFRIYLPLVRKDD